jgi:hypothetical protein
MFVPKQILDYFGVNLELVRNLQADLASLRTERDLLKQELTSTQIMSDWLRIQFNDLQAQNKGLLEKAYHIKLPVPELQNRPKMVTQMPPFSFDDPGDDVARTLGYSIP